MVGAGNDRRDVVDDLEELGGRVVRGEVREVGDGGRRDPERHDVRERGGEEIVHGLVRRARRGDSEHRGQIGRRADGGARRGLHAVRDDDGVLRIREERVAERRSDDERVGLPVVSLRFAPVDLGEVPLIVLGRARVDVDQLDGRRRAQRVGRRRGERRGIEIRREAEVAVGGRREAVDDPGHGLDVRLDDRLAERVVEPRDDDLSVRVSPVVARPGVVEERVLERVHVDAGTTKIDCAECPRFGVQRRRRSRPGRRSASALSRRRFEEPHAPIGSASTGATEERRGQKPFHGWGYSTAPRAALDSMDPGRLESRRGGRLFSRGSRGSRSAQPGGATQRRATQTRPRSTRGSSRPSRPATSPACASRRRSSRRRRPTTP